MKFITMLVLASSVMLCPELPATEIQERIIINYDDDARNQPQYTQPLYFAYYDQSKMLPTMAALPTNYVFEYCSNHDFHKILKNFQNKTRPGHLLTIGNSHFVTYYLRAEEDMHPKGSPSQYFLPKDRHLKVVLDLGCTAVENNILQFAVPDGYYFISDFDAIDDKSIKLSLITIKDILLQKAHRMKINQVTAQLTTAKLIKMIDDAKIKSNISK